MTISLIHTLRNGGCYWKRERYDSPGHSIVIPSSTPFNIPLDGPKSQLFVHGMCREGYFVLLTGIHKGKNCLSANEAVNLVREPSTNAFLYLQFQTDDGWERANALRQADRWRCDGDEEMAIELAIEQIRPLLKKAGKTLDPVQLVRKAAEVIERKPNFLVEARHRREVTRDMLGSNRQNAII